MVYELDWCFVISVKPLPSCPFDGLTFNYSVNPVYHELHIHSLLHYWSLIRNNSPTETAQLDHAGMLGYACEYQHPASVLELEMLVGSFNWTPVFIMIW